MVAIMPVFQGRSLWRISVSKAEVLKLELSAYQPPALPPPSQNSKARHVQTNSPITIILLTLSVINNLFSTKLLAAQVIKSCHPFQIVS